MGTTKGRRGGEVAHAITRTIITTIRAYDGESMLRMGAVSVSGGGAFVRRGKLTHNVSLAIRGPVAIDTRAA